MSVEYPTLPSSIPAPPSAFSDVTVTGDLVHIAGQTARKGGSKELGDIAAQAQTVFDKLEAILDAMDLGFASIASFRTYLVDVEDIPGYQAARRSIYQRIFPSGQYPPNTLLVVTALASPELRLEIEAVASR